MSLPFTATFYSYKGGVGRTLLAANVAVALARRGKTLLWDLDVEAPGLHNLQALRPSGKVEKGFFDWLVAWQKNAARPPGREDLKAFDALVQPTPYPGLFTFPAHGDEGDPAQLYHEIKWSNFLSPADAETLTAHPDQPRYLMGMLLNHLADLGFRHVLIDSRTGITDVGALLVGLLPHASVLVGSYGAQNTRGLSNIWKALKRDDSNLRSLRQGRPAPELLLVASPIPQLAGADVRTQGIKVWTDAFGVSLHDIIEIPHEPELLFSEALLIDSSKTIATSYLNVASRLENIAERVDADARAAEAQDDERRDLLSSGSRHASGKGKGRDSMQKQGKTFEERVANLLRLLGYDVQPEQKYDKNDVDLTARWSQGLEEAIYCVECKDYSGAVTKDVFEKLEIWLDKPEAKQLNARGMVVGRSFAPTALGYAREANILAFTIDELERKLADFSPLLARTITQFEQSPLVSAYVTQGAAPLLLDGNGAERKDTNSPSKADAAIANLVEYGVAWAEGRGSRLWVLLGDYGTGKTAFTQRLAYELAVRARDDATRPVPLLINLRDVPNKASLEDVLESHWKNVSHRAVSAQVLLHLISRGRVVLLLDSFDEIGIAQAGRNVVEQFRAMVRITGEAGDGTADRPAAGNRILVTCREQFFRVRSDVVRAARGESDRISPLMEVARGFDGSLDLLATFTDAQIGEYLRKRLGQERAHEAEAFIKRARLSTLADRPQLLEMIVKSLPDLMQLQAGGHALSAGALYQTYTNDWLDSFKPVERQSSSEQLRLILETLAFTLWNREGNRIHYADLAGLLAQDDALRNGMDPVQLDVELRTAAFLSRTPDGLYGFSHRSFLEYFYARRIQFALRQNDEWKTLRAVLNGARLNPEVCDFVGDLFPADQREVVQAATRALLSEKAKIDGVSASAAVRVNTLILGHRLAYKEGITMLPDDSGRLDECRARAAMKLYLPDRAQLDGCDLSQLDLSYVGLNNASMQNTTLNRTIFSGADLRGTNMCGAVARKMQLDAAHLQSTDWTNACCDDAKAHRFFYPDFSDAVLIGSSWINGDFRGAKIAGANFSDANLRCANFAHAIGPANFHKADLSGTTALHAQMLTKDVSRLATIRPKVVDADFALGHADSVSSAAFSSDGKFIVTASNDGTARVWDALSGHEIRALKGHGGQVTSAAFSSDGKFIVTASNDNTVRVWDALSGQQIRTLKGHDALVSSAAFSSDGMFIVTAGEDGTARVWDALSGQEVRALNGHGGQVNSAAFSADGMLIITSGDDNTARVWNTSGGREIRTLKGHEDDVTSAVFSNDRKFIVTASYDKTARVWNTSSGQEVRVLAGHDGRVMSAAFSYDGKLIVTASADWTARVWDALTGQEIRALKGHDWVTSAVFSHDGKFIVTAGFDGMAQVWETTSGQAIRAFNAHFIGGMNAAFSNDGKSIVTASRDGTARVWNTSSGQQIRTFKGHDDWVTSAAFSNDGKFVVTASEDVTARVWNALNGQEVHVLAGHAGGVMSAAFSCDGNFIVTAGEDGTARVWDALSGREVRALKGHNGRVWSAAFSNDGKFIVTASIDGTARVWGTSSGQEIRALKGHDSWVTRAAFSRDGNFIVTASIDGTARVWDTLSGQELRTLNGHDDWLRSAAFSSDGKFIVTASADGTARVWDVLGGQELHALNGHGGWVSSAVFSSDGKCIVTASNNGTVRVWDATTGAMLMQRINLDINRGWAALHFDGAERDGAPRWSGMGAAVGLIRYTDPAEKATEFYEDGSPKLFLPTQWLAEDLPELQADVNSDAP